MAARSILVTGAAGFIGSHVAEALLKRGDNVVGLDNFDDFYSFATKQRNIMRCMSSENYELIHGDIRDSRLLAEVFGRHKFDAIVHLAARAGVRPSITEPALYDDVNVVGTTRILQAAQVHGVPHVVFGSSSSVYGATSVPPFRETDVADRPSSPYAATKRANELACYAHHHLYGTTISCLRFFTVYGPRQRPEMAIHKFTRLIDKGERVTLYGNGTTRRDYTYVEDIAEGIISAVGNPNGYRIYNLGTTDTTALLDLVGMIASRLEKPLLVIHRDDQPGDVPMTHADISLAADELGYAPKVDIREGVDRFVSWYRSVNRSADSLAPRLAHAPSMIDLTHPSESVSEVAV